MNRSDQQQPVIEVCHGPECREFGADVLLRKIRDRGIKAQRGNCRGLCTFAPVVHIGEQCVAEANIDKVDEAVKPLKR